MGGRKKRRELNALVADVAVIDYLAKATRILAARGGENAVTSVKLERARNGVRFVITFLGDAEFRGRVTLRGAIQARDQLNALFPPDAEVVLLGERGGPH